MRTPSIRHVLVTAAALSLIVGSALPTPARQPDAGDVRVRASERARPPARVVAGSGRADVDRRVSRAVAHGGPVEALLVLDGAGTLARARASVAPGDSRELLRTVVPAYRQLKQGVRTRLPQLTVLRDYRTLPILHVLLRSRDVLDRAAADPAIVGIAANRRYRPTLTESLPLIGQPTAFAAGHTGAGTAVAVLDGGVDFTDPAFGTCPTVGAPGCKVVLAQDTAPDDGELDPDGHGTNVAGVVVGVAPDTRILAYDVFGSVGAAESDVLEGINGAIANQATFNVVAINLSLGIPEDYFTSPCSSGSFTFASAFANARAAGIVPVVAAGNSAFSNGAFHVGIGRPACAPGALPVGAVYDANVGSRGWGGPDPDDVCVDSTTAADEIACFSQAWANTLLLSPGALITAAGATFGGTSQAAPHAAGAVAVLVDSLPTATPDMVVTALTSSGPLINDALVGASFHRLDVPAAVAALAAAPPPPPPPPPPPGECTIEGDDRSNFLEGTPGDDVICGNGGGDVIVPNGGNDVVIGGRGFDFVSFENAPAGVVVDLAAGTASTGKDLVSLEGIDGALGTRFADSFFGDGGHNEFFGLGGSDLIDGRDGFDYARFDGSGRRIVADLSEGIARGEGADELVGIEALVGSRGNDRLFGDGKVNWIYGLGGDDLIVGAARADTLFGGGGADTLVGEGGNDDLFGGPGADRCDQGPGSGTSSSC